MNVEMGFLVYGLTGLIAFVFLYKWIQRLEDKIKLLESNKK